jgi:hypothetical protein
VLPIPKIHIYNYTCGVCGTAVSTVGGYNKCESCGKNLCAICGAIYSFCQVCFNKLRPEIQEEYEKNVHKRELVVGLTNKIFLWGLILFIPLMLLLSPSTDNVLPFVGPYLITYKK